MEELARNLAGLTWVWGDLLVLREVDREVRQRRPARGVRPAMVGRREEGRDLDHRAGRGHRPAGRHDHARQEGRRRLRHQRGQDLVDDGARLRLPAAAGQDQRGREVVVRQDAVPRADRPGRRRRDADPEARHALRRLVRGAARRRVRARHATCIGEVDRGWYHILSTLNNERILVAALATGVLRGVLEDSIAYAKDRRALRPRDRRLPDDPALDRRHEDEAHAGRAADLQGGLAVRPGDGRRRRVLGGEGDRRRSTRPGRPTAASRSWAATATPPSTTCSATGATCGCTRSAR